MSQLRTICFAGELGPQNRVMSVRHGAVALDFSGPLWVRVRNKRVNQVTIHRQLGMHQHSLLMDKVKLSLKLNYIYMSIRNRDTFYRNFIFDRKQQQKHWQKFKELCL